MKKQYFILTIFVLLFAAISLTACTHEHQYGAWTLEKEASCTESGIQVRICHCGQKETQFIPAVEHTADKWVAAAEPTCTAAGLRYQTCVDCKRVLQVAAIPATDHIEDAWFTVAEPTCTAVGLKYQPCAGCKLILQVASIPATGHTEGEWIIDREPTTTQEGSQHQICATCSATLKTEQLPVISGFLVVLDAGHGGYDPGSVVGGIKEKDINLQIADKLKELLEARGIAVILTRQGDVPLALEERTACANNHNAQLFVSVHCNFYDDDTSVRGFEAFYYQDEQAKSLATAITSDLAATGQVKTRNVKKDSFVVLKNTTMPAILLEMGFLTNEAERQKLCTDEYQQMLAEVIASRIARFLTQ